MNDLKPESKPATPDNPKASAELRCMELLADLDAQYKRFCAVRHTSVWGWSFEREHGAAMEIKPIVNKMFDTLIKLMETRSANAEVSEAADKKR
jgi:hypothetical protein